MLLSHCPNCEYDNQPGERFCAACGVPLDLKPCPVCGKVDSVKATVCAGCGAHFPPLQGEHVAAEEDGQVKDVTPLPIVAPPTTTMRATPLIIVALAAGGIPLLWLFRNTMPVPKVWQIQPPGIEVPAIPPAPRGQSETLPISPPQQSASVPSLIPIPPKVEEPEIIEPPKAAVAADPPRPKAKARSQKPAEGTAPLPPKPTVVSECTEALAAVGLCERKAAKE
jgi:hypothetical protein